MEVNEKGWKLQQNKIGRGLFIHLFHLTWTSIVRHMAESDFIDSCDTVTEVETTFQQKGDGQLNLNIHFKTTIVLI